jgi:CheY-like chemotaxis protein
LLQKILVVDDEPLIQSILAEEFEDAGYEVSKASSGSEAFQTLIQNKVDLIVSDVKMPGMSGIDLLLKIQSHLPQPPPMVLVSAFSETTAQEAYHEGAQGVFAKPIDYEALSKTVRKRLLPMREQYQEKETLGRTAFTLECSLAELDESLHTQSCSIGRGGFFLHMPRQFPRPGEVIAFKIAFGERDCVLEGQGLVRWTRSQAEGDAQTGIGVEFNYLTPESLDIFENLIEKITRPFIPLT